MKVFYDPSEDQQKQLIHQMRETHIDFNMVIGLFNIFNNPTKKRNNVITGTHKTIIESNSNQCLRRNFEGGTRREIFIILVSTIQQNCSDNLITTYQTHRL